MYKYTTNLPPSSNLLQAFRRAWIRPSVEAYAAEVPDASWLRVAVCLAIIVLSGYLTDFIDSYINGKPLTIFELLNFVWTPITFILGNLSLYGIARLLGGRGLGATFLQSFLIFSYLLVIIDTPFYVLYDLADLVPYAGACLTSLIFIYSLYLTWFALRVALQLGGRPAFRAIILHILLVIVVILAALIVMLLLRA
jgi:hypothetical protein